MYSFVLTFELICSIGLILSSYKYKYLLFNFILNYVFIFTYKRIFFLRLLL